MALIRKNLAREVHIFPSLSLSELMVLKKTVLRPKATWDPGLQTSIFTFSSTISIATSATSLSWGSRRCKVTRLLLIYPSSPGGWRWPFTLPTSASSLLINSRPVCFVRSWLGRWHIARSRSNFWFRLPRARFYVRSWSRTGTCFDCFLILDLFIWWGDKGVCSCSRYYLLKCSKKHLIHSKVVYQLCMGDKYSQQQEILKSLRCRFSSQKNAWKRRIYWLRTCWYTKGCRNFNPPPFLKKRNYVLTRLS